MYRHVYISCSTRKRVNNPKSCKWKISIANYVFSIKYWKNTTDGQCFSKTFSRRVFNLLTIDLGSSDTPADTMALSNSCSARRPASSVSTVCSLDNFLIMGCLKQNRKQHNNSKLSNFMDNIISIYRYMTA